MTYDRVATLSTNRTKQKSSAKDEKEFFLWTHGVFNKEDFIFIIMDSILFWLIDWLIDWLGISLVVVLQVRLEVARVLPGVAGCRPVQEPPRATQSR